MIPARHPFVVGAVSAVSAAGSALLVSQFFFDRVNFGATIIAALVAGSVGALYAVKLRSDSDKS